MPRLRFSIVITDETGGVTTQIARNDIAVDVEETTYELLNTQGISIIVAQTLHELKERTLSSEAM